MWLYATWENEDFSYWKGRQATSCEQEILHQCRLPILSARVLEELELSCEAVSFQGLAGGIIVLAQAGFHVASRVRLLAGEPAPVKILLHEHIDYDCTCI